MKKILLTTTLLVTGVSGAAYAGGEPVYPDEQPGTYRTYKYDVDETKNVAPAPEPAIQERVVTRTVVDCSQCETGGGSLVRGAGAESDSIVEAVKNGRAYISGRYRYEHVDDDGFTEDAEASTLRTRLGFETGNYRGFSGLLEFEDVTEIGSDDFNNGSNGKTTFPVVADPQGTELNQAYLQFDGIDDTVIRGGRQVVNMDNLRFVGDVGWRQNNQTFDGAVVQNKSLPDTTLTYGYVYNVNRIFGNDHPTGDLNTDTHIINAKYSGIDFLNITGFGYLIDISNSLANSSNTYGVRLNGKLPLGEVTDNGGDLALLYDGSWATQSDAGDNPNNYDAQYYHIEGGVGVAGAALKVGYEVLGADVAGDAGRVFRTPLATLHKFNGWADKFLATPAGGLEDFYGVASYKLNNIHEHVDGTKLTLAYHMFEADKGGAEFGDEIDASITQTFLDHYNVGLKYASYDADSNAPAGALANDTQKFMVTFGVHFSQ